MTEQPSRSDLEAAAVLAAVGEWYGLPNDQLRRPGNPRRVAVYILKDLLNLSLVEIGRVLGGVDHSSVRNDLKYVDGAKAADMDFAMKLGNLSSSAATSIAYVTRCKLVEGFTSGTPISIARRLLAAPHGEVTISGAEARVLAEAYLDQLVARLGASS